MVLDLAQVVLKSRERSINKGALAGPKEKTSVEMRAMKEYNLNLARVRDRSHFLLTHASDWCPKSNPLASVDRGKNQIPEYSFETESTLYNTLCYG